MQLAEKIVARTNHLQGKSSLNALVILSICLLAWLCLSELGLGFWVFTWSLMVFTVTAPTSQSIKAWVDEAQNRIPFVAVAQHNPSLAGTQKSMSHLKPFRHNQAFADIFGWVEFRILFQIRGRVESGQIWCVRVAT